MSDFKFCTHAPESECTDCSIRGELKCRFHAYEILLFQSRFFLFLIPALWGLRHSRSPAGVWMGWFAYLLAFFALVLPLVLCRHCPYYARKGKILYCLVTAGVPKLWPFDPEPIRPWEKGVMATGFILVGAFPVIALLAMGAWPWAGAAAVGFALFFYLERKFNCSRCLNFSCLFNRVPPALAGAYRQRQRG